MPVTFEELAPGVFAAIAPEGGANAGFIVGDEGVFVVDTLMLPAQTKELIGHIKQVTKKEIRFLLNTHDHGDHVLGNYQFSPPAQIISQINMRAHLAQTAEATVSRMLQFRPELKDELQGVKLPLPSITFTQRLNFHWGNKTIELRHLGPAHTQADTIAYLPQDRLLFSGDLLFSHTVPALLAEGSSLGWIDSLNLLETLPLDRIVPGHGPLATKRELGQAREYLMLFRQGVRNALQQGWSKEEAAQRIKIEKYASWVRQERVTWLVDKLYAELGK